LYAALQHTAGDIVPPEPHEKDLLAQCERNRIPSHYAPYYLNKRHNLCATVDQFPYVWNCFMHLDEIVLREFDTMQRLRDPYLMLPMILFMNAHQKTRVAFELGCSACLPEAISIMRDAIESAAHGNRLASDPKLLKPWLEKNDSKTAESTFKQEFEHNKSKQLFNGLPELHKMWGQFSEFGAHTNINSIVTRSVLNQTSTDVQFVLNYTGVANPTVLVLALFEMILVFSEIEKLRKRTVLTVCTPSV
jgi:hypothetical protein